MSGVDDVLITVFDNAIVLHSERWPTYELFDIEIPWLVLPLKDSSSRNGFLIQYSSSC